MKTLTILLTLMLPFLLCGCEKSINEQLWDMELNQSNALILEDQSMFAKILRPNDLKKYYICIRVSRNDKEQVERCGATLTINTK